MLALVGLLSACDEARPPPPRTEPRDDGAAREASPDVVEPTEEMTLRLPRPGERLAEVLDQIPECREALEPDRDRCRFHGAVEPLPQRCQDGCTWWTYRFVEGRLDVAELERAEWDADAELAGQFAEEARRIARELDRQLDATGHVERLGEWSAVEDSPDGTRVLLERRLWSLDDRLVTWTLSGQAGHHPGVLLRVRVEAPRPDELRVEMLDPDLRTGAPLLRLRGGPVPRPFDVPLWLTFDEADRAQDTCALHHEALAFALEDGRIYVGQYNSWCGGARQCRLIDPYSGAASEPEGGCLWGDGIHHRAEAIGGGHVLLTSDAEGTGAVQIVRYDPERGAEVELELSISPYAPLRAEVRDGGVDLSTPCALPPGCEMREYGEVPSRAYRWTPARGLFRVAG